MLNRLLFHNWRKQQNKMLIDFTVGYFVDFQGKSPSFLIGNTFGENSALAATFKHET
jgi:hypothetical protein